MNREYNRIGQLLVRKGLLTEEQVQKALQAQSECHSRLGEVISAMGWVSDEDLATTLAEQFDYEYLDIKGIEPDSEALNVVSGRWALANLVLPLKWNDGRFEIALSDPIDVKATDEIRQRVRCPLRIYLSVPDALKNSIIRSYTIECEVSPKKLGKGRRQKIDSQPDRDAIINAVDNVLGGAA
ncbi:MAG TPA: hypothetical protein VNI20_01925 [Fimbriimonadaceae bacterium]|nr:hypothetical protein [Fimbriimonadaceae bacterium]